MIKIVKTICVFLFALNLSLSAQHTFSIVAIDEATGAIGSAGATCLNTLDCGVCTAQIISDIVPGVGAINAQASVCIPNINLENGMVQLLGGLNATDLLQWLLVNDACTAGNVTSRQYGIVTIDDAGTIDAAGFTGASCFEEAVHILGPNYAIQGNILIEENVLDSMEAGFLKPGLSFEEKMMAALQGANRPGADSRCLSEGISAKSAYIRIAYPDDAPGQFGVDLLIPVLPTGEEPIDALQELFDANVASGISDPLISSKMASVFPNPIYNNQVNIEWISSGINEGTFEFMDVSGKAIFVKNIQQQSESFDLSSYNLSGAYIYKIKNNKTNLAQTGRLVFVKK